MTTLRETAQQALEALEYRDGDGADQWKADVITALRAALAQEQAEPVAWLQPKTMDAHLRPDVGYETCSSVDYGAFPVYRAPPKAEQAQEPVAVVGTQVDVWRGCDGRWAPPGEPIKTALMLKDMPVGTMLYTTPPKAEPVQEPVAWIHTDPDKPRVKFLEWRENEPGYRGRWIKTPLYTTPPKRQPLSGLEVERLLEQVIGSLPAARNLVRAVERAHGIIEPRIEEDSHQTLDDAMQQPRAMAQAYEAGYKAGVAHEREACAKVCEQMPELEHGWRVTLPSDCAAAIRARENT